MGRHAKLLLALAACLAALGAGSAPPNRAPHAPGTARPATQCSGPRPDVSQRIEQQLQRLIFPGARSRGAPWAVVRPGPGEAVVQLKTDTNEAVTALYAAALRADGRVRTDADARPTVLYFYGNAQCIAYSAETIDFGRMGLNVLVPDYVGYGMSAGQASDDGVYRTAEAAYAYLVQQRHIAPDRIVVASRSMGGAAAIYLASRHPVGGLATFSTFTTLGEAAHRVVPWLPAEAILGHRMDNHARMAKVACPVWIAYGGADVVVPPAMSERLASAAPPASHAQRVCILRADHNNLFQVGERDLLSRFAQFVQQSTAPRAGAPNRN